MANSVNKVFIIGNVGADPEVRQAGDAQVATVRIACTERWKGKSGQKQEKTEWITCIGWRNHAELLEKYVHKGDKIHIEGKLQTRMWEDKNGGGKRYATEVIIKEITFLTAPSGGGQSSGGYGGGSRGHAPAHHGGSDDIPDFGGTIPAPADRDYPQGPDDDLPF